MGLKNSAELHVLLLPLQTFAYDSHDLVLWRQNILHKLKPSHGIEDALKYLYIADLYD